MTADRPDFLIEVHRYPQEGTCKVRYFALAYEGGRATEELLGEVAVPIPAMVDEDFRQPHYQWLREHAGMTGDGQCATRTAATLSSRPQAGKRRTLARLAGGRSAGPVPAAFQSSI
jgi:hypothetical protein